MTEAQSPLATKPLASRLAAMLALNHTIYTDHDLDVLIRRLLGMVCEVIGAEAASLALIDADTQELVFQFAVGDAGQQVERFRLPLGHGLAGWVASNGQPVRTADVASDPRFLGRVDQASGFATRSLLAVPLRCNGRILGVLEGLNKREGGFSADDEALCTVLANTVAISLEHFQLHKLYRQRLSDLPQPEALAPDEQVMMDIQQQLSAATPLSGALSARPLAAVLRVLADSHVTGQLTVDSRYGRAELTLAGGELADAWLPARRLVGTEAALEALTWTEGTWRFTAQPPKEGRTITGPLWLLLARGRTHRETLTQWQARLPDSLPLQTRSSAPPADHVLARSIWPLLPATVGEVMAQAACDRFTLYEALASLISTGSLG